MTAVVQVSTPFNLAGASSTAPTSFPILPANGHPIICILAFSGGSAASSVSAFADNQGGSLAGGQWAKRNSAYNLGGANVEIYDRLVTSGLSGTFTITATMASSALFGAIVALEIDQLFSGSPYDQSGTYNSSASVTSLTVTATGANTNANSLVIAAIDNNGPNTSNLGINTPANTGYTSFYVNQDVNAVSGLEFSYKIVSSIETSSANWAWTAGASTTNGAIISTYQATAAVSTTAAMPWVRA